MSISPHLRRVWNPPNPYLAEHRELLGEPPVAELEVWEDHSKSVLSKNESPDLGFRWSVNPYRGCFHACAYCYARTTHEYLGLGAGSDFERKLFVKPDAPALLAAAFRKKSWRRELVAFSGVTDCYQPLEAAWKLTRRCLEVCAEFRNPVGIVTKSALVRRDLDILEHLNTSAAAHVCISIPFLDEDIVRKLEPGTATVKRRLETVEFLADHGIPVGVAVSPIIPGLNDADVPRILQEAHRAGARTAFRTLLRLPGSVEGVFLHRLREEMPLRADRVESRIREVRGGKLNDSRFGKRHVGKGKYWSTIDEMWELWTRRLGFKTGETAAVKPGPPPDLPPPPPPTTQMELSL
ncbi:MAG: PA0069 family radical SAM protein [Gemmatimonadetes bacterium]|nr:PA0069 family radical SAM protein [Gemmatimonadota bacterium]